MNISQKKLEKSKGRLEIKIKDQNLQKLFQQGSSKALIPMQLKVLPMELMQIVFQITITLLNLLNLQ